MNAKYYRYLFHKVTEGLCYSGSISDQTGEKREDLCFLYLAGGENCKEKGESYAAPENDYEFLILGDFAPAAVERARRVAESGKTKEILIPDGEENVIREVTAILSQAGAAKVRVVKETEWIYKCREVFQIVPADHGERKSLMLYHADEKDDTEKEECLICVKPSMEDMCCMAKADADTLACEMRCMLYNDFTLCKRHNQRSQNQFVDGHLLFASAKEAGMGTENEKALLELVRSHAKKLRVIGFADKNLSPSEAEEIMESGAKGFARYMVGTADTPAETIKTISSGDPYRRFFEVSEQAGLCISGYYVLRRV